MDIRSRKTRQAPKRTIMSDKIKEYEAFEKKDVAIRAAIARSNARLDASQNAPRIVEQPIGGKLVTKPKHSG